MVGEAFFAARVITTQGWQLRHRFCFLKHASTCWQWQWQTHKCVTMQHEGLLRRAGEGPDLAAERVSSVFYAHIAVMGGCGLWFTGTITRIIATAWCCKASQCSEQLTKPASNRSHVLFTKLCSYAVHDAVTVLHVHDTCVPVALAVQSCLPSELMTATRPLLSSTDPGRPVAMDPLCFAWLNCWPLLRSNFSTSTDPLQEHATSDSHLDAESMCVKDHDLYHTKE